MKKQIVAIGLILVICGIGSYFFLPKQKAIKEYTSNLSYMDTYIYIKIYSKDEAKAKSALEKVEALYQDYYELSDRYNHYEGKLNLYDILHNTSIEEYIEIDPKLYEMISYGMEWLEKSGGLLDIRIGNIIDIWKTYRDIGIGIPSMEELTVAKNNVVTDIVLKEGNLIKNNHPNLDLSLIVRGYATEKVGEYLESVGIDEYIINTDGNIKVGSHYNHSTYSIGIEDPNSSTGDIYKVVYGNHISVASSGGYNRYYEYNQKQYHYIIDPNTLFPSNHCKNVTVITNSSIVGDVLSTILFLLPIDEGKTLIEGMDFVEAIWYTNDNIEIKTDGFTRYEMR